MIIIQIFNDFHLIILIIIFLLNNSNKCLKTINLKGLLKNKFYVQIIRRKCLIIEVHGGLIKVETEKNKGKKFDITLPIETKHMTEEIKDLITAAPECKLSAVQ
jgi:hypothetical protein